MKAMTIVNALFWGAIVALEVSVFVSELTIAGKFFWGGVISLFTSFLVIMIQVEKDKLREDKGQ